MPTFTTTSAYLRADDLPPDGDTVLTIASFEKQSLRQGERTVEKWVLHFHEREGGLALNDTNGRVLCELLGKEMDGWIGRPISLFVDPHIQYNGSPVAGIRIRPFIPGLPA